MKKDTLACGMLKRLTRIAGFLICAVTMLCALNQITSYKYGDGMIQPQLVEDLPANSCDVMFFGSSRVFENIDTGQLWDEWGIAAFSSCGSVQPLWDTYYYMKQAFERQHPRVAVVEVYRALETRDYVDESRIIKNTFNLPAHLEVSAKQVSAPQDQLSDYLLEFPFYHGRAEELTREDFLPHMGSQRWVDWKGFGPNYTQGVFQEPDVSGVSSRSPLSEKSQKYLEMIVDLCAENEIPLVFILAPYPLTAEEQAVFNSVADYASAQGVPFINYNLLYDDLRLDFASDFASDQHLNYQGARKFTQAVGSYLVDRYDLPDRRGNSAYESWQRDADDIRARARDHELSQISDPAELLVQTLQSDNSDDYLILVAKNACDLSWPGWGSAATALSAEGLNDSLEPTGAFALGDGELLYSTTAGTYEWYTDAGSKRVMVSRGDAGDASMRFTGERVDIPTGGLTILIYNVHTDQVAARGAWTTSAGGYSRVA